MYHLAALNPTADFRGSMKSSRAACRIARSAIGLRGGPLTSLELRDLIGVSDSRGFFTSCEIKVEFADALAIPTRGDELFIEPPVVS